MDAEQFDRLICDIIERRQRDQEQAIRKGDLYAANFALGGKETCEELRRELKLRDHAPLLRSEPRRRAS